MSINCGHCKDAHASVQHVRECSTGDLFEGMTRAEQDEQQRQECWAEGAWLRHAEREV